MKIYTRTGDAGATSLFSGERVEKSDARVEAYGTLDELSSHLGLLAALLPPDQGDLAREIQEFQADLLTAGAVLATAPGAAAAARLAPLDPERTKALEASMDKMSLTLPPLSGFILPGGHRAAAQAHVARCVCRRAERAIVSLRGGDAGDGERLREVLAYVNRLSDWLFTAARHVNHLAGVPDIQWRAKADAGNYT